MAFNYRQWPLLGYVSHPDFSSAGAFTFTFDDTATQAQVDADASLFNLWSSLAAEAVLRDGPVRVYFRSNCTVTGGAGDNSFPEGSQLIGLGSVHPTLSTGPGVQVRGVTYWENVELNCVPGGNTDSYDGSLGVMHFKDCTFSVTNPGTVGGFENPEGLLILDNCQDVGGLDVGANAVDFFFGGANEYFIEARGGTPIAGGAFATDAAAGTLNFTVEPGCSVSGFFPFLDAAWNPSTFQLNGPPALPNGNLAAVGAIGGDVAWPAAPDPETERSTSLLTLSAASSGHNVAIGNPSPGIAFAMGQILRVVNVTPGAAHALTLLQPNGVTNIPIATTAGINNTILLGDSAVAGQLRGVTLRCFQPTDLGKVWDVIDTFIVPA
jgi:hypothetical protein